MDEFHDKLIRMSDLQGTHRIVSLVGIPLKGREHRFLQALKRLGIIVPCSGGFFIW